MADITHILAGAFAAIVTATTVQPLDVIKTSIITSQTRSISETYRYVFDMHGIKGFWRGLKPASLKAFMGGGIQFSMLEFLNKYFAGETGVLNKFLHDSQSAAIARLAVITFLSPLSIIKVRMEAPQFNDYTNLAHAFRKIYSQEGIRGFYQGLFPSLLRDLPYSALAYAFYEQYSCAIFHFSGYDKSYSINTFFSGVLAGFTSCLITQPFDIMKTRLQFAFVSGQKSSGFFNGLCSI